ncbi:MAG: class I adenylate-forming enzyme family protein [Pseudodonghicola sp.]
MALDVENLRGRRNTDRWNRTSIGDVFERITWADPDREVIVAWDGAYENPENARLSAARADALANRYANAMRAAGIREGRIVMMICENSAEAILCKIGLAKAGITVAPVNPNLNADVLQDLVQLCKPAAIIADSDFCAIAAELADRNGFPLLMQIVLGQTSSDAPSFAAFIAGAPETEPEVEIHGDDIWQLLFTSGSTSTPKGVMQSHHNVMYTALSFTGSAMVGLDYESNYVACSFLPVIYHVGDAFLYKSIMCDGKIVIGRRFHPRQIAEAVEREKVTLLWGGAPHAIEAINAEWEKDTALSTETLRTVIFGWAPMNPVLRERVHARAGAQVKFVEIIGQTEVCCAHRFWLEKHDALYRETAPKENYVGQPQGLLAAKISDPEGNPIPMGDDRVGEAVYRSPALMAGYFRKPEDTAEAFRNGWFHGGDAFKWGRDGQRILADRLKDIVKSGGENVTSIRVEAVVTAHPAVLKTAVVGLPHRRWGEAVTAFVILRPGAAVSDQELAEHVKSHLAPFERPKRYMTLEALPETIGGKVQKHVLRQTYAELYEAEE